MAGGARYLEHLATVPLFSACTKRELAQLARRSTEVLISAGKELTTEGSMGREFFVIVAGEADVVRGGKTVARLGPGAFFGELALLERAPRNASIVAATQMDVVVLNQNEFRECLVEVPSMTLKLLTGMARRLRELDSGA